MSWRPWKDDIAEQKRKLAESGERIERIESNWDFIRDQVRQAKRHRERNHITELITGVARGER